MRALWWSCLLGVAAACRDEGAGPVAPLPPAGAAQEDLAGELAAARGGCIRCHAVDEAARQRLAPPRGPALADAAHWHAADGGEAFLRRHHGGQASADLAAWVVSLSAGSPEPQPVVLPADALALGERRLAESACRACHADAALAALAGRTDHARLAAFLRHPAGHRPATAHPRLPAEEADAVAAWLLRGRAAAPVRQPGLACECFEVAVVDAGLPSLEGLVPARTGVVPHIDASFATRADHVALRFQATIDVPVAGDWTFVSGSDDSSWLWIDGQLVVSNEGLAPYRRKKGTIRLDAGPHALRVVYTEAEGEERLDVLWSGPGIAEQVLPRERVTVTTVTLPPPPPPASPAVGSVVRGRRQAVERRCGACHDVEDPGLAAIAASSAPSDWSALRGGECPQVQGAAAIWAAARASLARPRPAAAVLQLSLQRDGCLSCHVRDGRGGLPPVVRQGLAATEDLGDEGRLPPDLTVVGRRLRPQWIEGVLARARTARPYLRIAMPSITAEAARRYAELFAEVDGRPGDDDEPPFSAAAVRLGRQLAGTTGRNCITCHPFAGRRALGPQGMDLALQHERVRPGWFREWLLHPATLRPGTRMPALWSKGDAQDRAEIDALFSWASLGAAAPVPDGLAAPPGSLLIDPVDRPRLHGAFLKGLSARCVAVGSPDRVHYAYDVEHARLAWIWRGAFLDASGTWAGRAGKLLEPLGEDWVVLGDLGVTDESDPPSGNSGHRAVLGHRLDADGYPVWRVLVGVAEYEDHIRPRLVAGGSELVRMLRVVEGTLKVDVAPTSGAARLQVSPAGVRALGPGQSMEIVYRW